MPPQSTHSNCHQRVVHSITGVYKCLTDGEIIRPPAPTRKRVQPPSGPFQQELQTVSLSPTFAVSDPSPATDRAVRHANAFPTQYQWRLQQLHRRAACLHHSGISTSKVRVAALVCEAICHLSDACGTGNIDLNHITNRNPRDIRLWHATTTTDGPCQEWWLLLSPPSRSPASTWIVPACHRLQQWSVIHCEVKPTGSTAPPQDGRWPAKPRYPPEILLQPDFGKRARHSQNPLSTGPVQGRTEILLGQLFEISICFLAKDCLSCASSSSMYRDCPSRH